MTAGGEKSAPVVETARQNLRHAHGVPSSGGTPEARASAQFGARDPEQA